MKKVIFSSAMMLIALVAMAKDIKAVVVTTQPQMHCENCEKKIKGNLRFEKGVKEIQCDIEGQRVTITYDADKTNVEAIIKSFGNLYGFVGHNGGGNFIAFFPKCPGSKADVILKAIDRQVKEYNRNNPDREIHYSCGKAVSDEDGTFEIRQLLRLAMQKMNSDQAR